MHAIPSSKTSACGWPSSTVGDNGIFHTLLLGPRSQQEGMWEFIKFAMRSILIVNCLVAECLCTLNLKTK